jgi:hypothetical protein
MTYRELYASVSQWTARHIAQDLMLTHGPKTRASEADIDRVILVEEYEKQTGLTWTPAKETATA